MLSFICYDYSVEGKRFKETRPFNTFTRIPVEDQTNAERLLRY